MPEYYLATNAIVVLAILVAWKLWSDYSHDKKYRFPPKVPGYPIIGSWLEFPTIYQGEWAKKKAEKYGEM